MKMILFANTDWYLWNFRRELIEEIRRHNWEVVLVSPPGTYGQEFLTRGIRWIALDMQRNSANPLRELKAIISLWAIYRREQPDLVHHFTLKSVIHGSLAARLAGVNVRVNAIAGLGYIFSSQSYKARLLRPIISFLLKAALSGSYSRVIFQNPDDLQVFTDAKLLDASRLKLIRGSGVDTSRFIPAPRDVHARCQILMATRLLWSKGIEDYVAAARALVPTGLSVDFLVAGTPDPGSPDSVPEETIEAWRAEGNVKFLGHVKDMDRLLSTVDVVVLPSRYAEGVPRILLEAAAASAALITTNRPGCREIVVDDVTGILVPPGDTSALISALKCLIVDPERRARLGLAARRKAQAEFEECRVIQATIDVYEEAIMARSTPDRRAKPLLTNQ
ncbi:MAG TPA: glycosyltransferase family 4 protein [Dongiaceae bacterium]